MKACRSFAAGVAMVALAGAGIGAGPAAAGARLSKHTASVAKIARPERIEVYPKQMALHSRRDCRQLVVTGYFHGQPHDLTHSALYDSSNTHVVRCRDGVVAAAGDGKATLRVEACGKSASVPITVANFANPDPIRFKFETLAVLTKQGCATGSCHGSPHGKGGFSLSLFGYAPTIDRISLTRDGFSRRIDVQEPAESLMLKKPLLEIPHVGGKRLHKTDAAYHILSDWIAQGANVDLPQTECSRIEVYPQGEQLFGVADAHQQLSVLAYYSDGTVRDVTAIATYDTSNAGVATVAPDGLVTGHSRGQTAISVRYLDKLESVHFTRVVPVPGFVWKSPPENNMIDRLVNAKLKQLEYLPAETCSDAVFVRRVTLDLTGLLPTQEQVRTFLADTAVDKRAKWIDVLLDSEEYARFWALKRADLMRVSPQKMPGKRADLFSQWIVDAVRSNMPYDQFARSLLTASGDTEKNPAANYYLAIPSLEERTEMTSQIFLGARVECAKCHNHPFENWTMRDYYSIGAVFARTRIEGNRVVLASSGETENPTTREVMLPWGMDPGRKQGQETEDRRVLFANWLIKPGNPFFARVAVNRIWATLLGRGIVEPVDDFRSSNPPSNGALLDSLAAEFEKSGYNCKQMIRLICTSQTYQRSCISNRFNETDDSLFSHARVRLLTAEQLKDAIGLSTQVLAPPASGAVDRKQFATERAYPEGSSFMTTFGQPERLTACTCERQSSPTLLQALELLNGGTAYQMAQAGARMYAKQPDDALIESLYLSSLSRYPTEKERTTARNYLQKAAHRDDAVMDLIWTVINTQEFLFQH